MKKLFCAIIILLLVAGCSKPRVTEGDQKLIDQDLRIFKHIHTISSNSDVKNAAKDGILNEATLQVNLGKPEDPNYIKVYTPRNSEIARDEAINDHNPFTHNSIVIKALGIIADKIPFGAEILLGLKGLLLGLAWWHRRKAKKQAKALTEGVEDLKRDGLLRTEVTTTNARKEEVSAVNETLKARQKQNGVYEESKKLLSEVRKNTMVKELISSTKKKILDWIMSFFKKK